MAEKLEETLPVGDAVIAAVGSQHDDGGVHFRRRLEGAGLHVEEHPGICEEGCLQCEVPVLMLAGTGHQAVGDLFLNQEDGPWSARPHRFLQDRRCDVIGKVAGDRHRRPIAPDRCEGCHRGSPAGGFRRRTFGAGTPPGWGRVRWRLRGPSGAIVFSVSAPFPGPISMTSSSPSGQTAKAMRSRTGAISEKVLTEFLRHV